MGRDAKGVRWVGLTLAVVGGLLIVNGISGLHAPALPNPTLTPTPEPIVPTRTPVVEEIAAPTLQSGTATNASIAPTVTPSLTTSVPSASQDLPSPPDVVPSETPPSAEMDAGSMSTPEQPGPTGSDTAGYSVPETDRWRIGVSLPYGAGRDDNLTALGVGWVMDWNVRASVDLSDGIDYAQTVRMWGGVLRPEADVLTSVAAARPGSLWLISNEPDVRWQDNVTPEVYARLYHEAYAAIKSGDPTAEVAAGGISQPSDLRLRYLDLVLQSYQARFGAALPAQVWHIHNYMLREERDSWGVDIPPGISDNTGALYAISDSANLALFEEQIWTFRRWMASRGYGGQPLVISEFGVPMPEDYGFPPDVMAEFLRETWRFFLTASDVSLGDPTDSGRLVQQACWFSLAFLEYPTGDLVDRETGVWTPLGLAWLSMMP